MGRGQARPDVPAAVILLDTNAVIWLAQGHRRAAPLARASRLYLSPATLLELQFLVELGKVRVAGAFSPDAIVSDPRWLLDEPPPGKWFTAAAELGWTRDPFDRLLVAHAHVRRWRLATGDAVLKERLRPSQCLSL